jgi:DNA-binding response OmpR family regulator
VDVWIVDDDDDMAHAVGLMLDMLDCKSRHFRNARSGAQALLAETQPDLMILDINMPEVSGLDMLEFVRRRASWDSMPVIMLTSEHADVLVDKALSLGADGFVLKPLMFEELERALSTAFEKRKNLKEGK